jgi:hypothetical protein
MTKLLTASRFFALTKSFATGRIGASTATNDFVNAGGDFYTMFKDGQGVTREVMADVLLEYIKARTPISPTLDGRITKLP